MTTGRINQVTVLREARRRPRPLVKAAELYTEKVTEVTAHRTLERRLQQG